MIVPSCLLATLSLGALMTVGGAPDLRAGASAVVITPPAGTPMAGYYNERAAEAVHDDLFAKALVLEQGGSKAALVVLDLISTTRPIVEEARKQVEDRTGIPGDRVMISASHSHTGPVIRGRSAFDKVLGGENPLSIAFAEGLPGKIAEAVEQANARLQPVLVSVGHGRESSVAFNRRFHMIDGTVGWNPGKLNPRILKPAGGIDPDLPVVSFSTTDKKPIAAYVNHAVHLDNIGGLKISADVPGVVAARMADALGPELVTLWSTGCCGDVNHINVQSAMPQSGFGNAARMGTILSAEILKTWPNLGPIQPAGLRVRSEIVELPSAPHDEAELAAARDVLARLQDKTAQQPTFLEQVKAFRVLDVAAREGKPWPVEVQVVTLGRDLAWVSLPGEIFVELGLAIKQDSPYPHTIIAELANGAIGYIPSARAYPQGNYEPVSARCAQGSGEKLVAAAVRMLHAAYAESAPSEAK